MATLPTYRRTGMKHRQGVPVVTCGTAVKVSLNVLSATTETGSTISPKSRR